jgi:hypothetical protein
VANRPQTIQIYLPSGDPEGIRVASLTTRTVRMFDVPRTLLPEFLAMEEAHRVGVYYLFGTADDESPQCYIGQGGTVGNRLKTHAGSKEFWTRAMVAISLTDEWTVTHSSYLEWLSISMAQTAGRYVLDNGNGGSNTHTPKPLEADCLEFIETIAVLLATLGEPVLEEVKTPRRRNGARSGRDSGPPKLFLRARGCDGSGFHTPEGMVVLSGSRGSATLTPSASKSLSALRLSLQGEGVVTMDDSGLLFLKDYLFRTPSAASAFLMGSSSNGREHWKTEDGLSINELEQLALSHTHTDDGED